MESPDRHDEPTPPPPGHEHGAGTSTPALSPATPSPATEGRRGWTQAEIDAEIALLGDVPMYHPSPHSPDSADAPEDGSWGAGAPNGIGSGLTDEIDPDATAVHRPADSDGPARTSAVGGPSGFDTASGTGSTPLGAGTTAAQRLELYGWLFGDERQPDGPRAAHWRHPDSALVSDGPATAPMTPVGVSRVHPVANAVPRPAASPSSSHTGTQTLVGASGHGRRRGRRGVLIVLVLTICLSLGTAAGIVGFRLSGSGAPLAGLFGTDDAATPPESVAPVPGRVWDGAVKPIGDVTSAADCVDPPGNDDGEPVLYEASNLLDGDPATAWRCTGTSNRSVTFQLPEDAMIAEVGLVNGYAKDVGGTDRYPLYQRALLVRWTFADGTSITQELADDTRSVQSVRIPTREGGPVTLEVLKVSNPSVQSATRDAVALSGVVFLTPEV